MIRSLLLTLLAVWLALGATSANAQSRAEYGPYTCDYCHITGDEYSPPPATLSFIESIVNEYNIDMQVGDVIIVCDGEACGVYQYNGNGAYEQIEAGSNSRNQPGWGSSGYDPVGPGGARTTNWTCWGPACGYTWVGDMQQG